MKKFFAMALMAVCTFGAFAQEEVSQLSTRDSALTRSYLRPSISKIYLVDGSSVAMKYQNSLENYVDRKFDINPVANNTFKYNGGDVNEQIQAIIADQKIGNQIMKSWFPTFDATNGYGTEILEQRGEFAATDNDVLEAKASQRNSAMFTLGEQLIDRSYVVCYLIQDASTVDKKTGKKTEKASVTPYVYKLDFNEEVRTNFYNNYFTTANGIDQCEFPVVFVTNAKGSETLMGDFDADDYRSIMNNVNNVNDFQVKSPVAEVRPIRSKIGTKEGLCVDKRFDVMENELKEDGSIVAKRVATVRVKKVADNDTIATGETTEMSKFYQIKGRGVQEGMTLVENDCNGLHVGILANTAAPGLEFGYRLGKNVGVPGLILGLEAGLLMDEDFGIAKIATVKVIDKYNGIGQFEDSFGYRVGLFVAKEFNFARNFVFTPRIAGGFLMGAKELFMDYDGKIKYYPVEETGEAKDAYDSYYVEAALRIGFMASRNVQIFAEGGYSYSILSDNYKFSSMVVNNYNLVKPQALRLGLGCNIYF